MLQTRRHTVLLKAFYYLTRAKPSHVLPSMDKKVRRTDDTRPECFETMLCLCEMPWMHHASCIVHCASKRDVAANLYYFCVPCSTCSTCCSSFCRHRKVQARGYDDACVATAQLGNDTTRHDTTQHSETSAVALTFSTPSSILFDFIPWTTPRRRFSG